MEATVIPVKKRPQISFRTAEEVEALLEIAKQERKEAAAAHDFGLMAPYYDICAALEHLLNARIRKERK